MMSDSSFPYQPPDPFAGAQPPPDGNAPRPSRRAMIVMVILGAILLALGACCAGVGHLMPITELPPAQKQQLTDWASQNHVSVEMIGQAMISAGITGSVAGVLLLILSIFVYRESFAGTIVALVLAGLMVAGIGVLMLPGLLLNALQMPEANSLAGLMMIGGVLALCVWLVVLLARAIKSAAGRQEELRRQQAQYHQSLEHERRYEQPPDASDS